MVGRDWDKLRSSLAILARTDLGIRTPSMATELQAEISKNASRFFGSRRYAFVSSRDFLGMGILEDNVQGTKMSAPPGVVVLRLWPSSRGTP